MNTDFQPKPPVNPFRDATKDLANKATDAVDQTASRASDAAKNVEVAAKNAATDLGNEAKDAYKNVASKVEEGADRASDYLQDAVNTAKDMGNRVSDRAKEIYQSAAVKAEDTLTTSKEYTRQNPVLVVLGAVAFGAAIGCMMAMSRRQPTFRQRCVDEPLGSARDAILAAMAPVAQRLSDGYDTARDGAGKAMDRAQRFNAGRTVDSISEQIGRVGNNLKFW